MMWRTSAAYSAGLPRRGGNGTPAARDSRTSGVMPAIIGVSKMPGAMVITRIPKRASSRAAGKVRLAIAPLEAAYAAWPICPSNAATEAVLMITPRSPSAFASVSAIAAAARRNRLKLPIRLTLITWAKFARPCGPFLPRIFSPRTTPAQLISPCKPPKASTAAVTAASAAASWLMSATALRALSPSCSALAATASAFKSTSITLAPAAISISAVAAPRPDAPPLTRNTLFSICIVVSF